jgi:DNA-binding NtrC family response regulator
LKKPYIAMVGDDSALANLRTFLSRQGYETRSYSHGDEMIAAVRRGDRPDLLLLDAAMPGANSTETLRVLMSARPDLQVIVLSRERTATIVELTPPNDRIVRPADLGGPIRTRHPSIKSPVESPRLVGEIDEFLRQVTAEQDRAILFWSNSAEMNGVKTFIEQASRSNQTVLIRGETGVGKDLVAHVIHRRSQRGSRPFMKVNCASLPNDRLESQLFGHERHAQSPGATTSVSKLEQANSGTIFLDEIGDMKATVQAKLLRAFQDGRLTKLARRKSLEVDVRVVAATNRNLEAMLAREEFLRDFYDRMKPIEVTVPPLRNRRSEIPQLCDFFVDRYARQYNRPVPQMSPWLRRMFLAYEWPGNVRELKNMIKRIVILQDEQLVLREMVRAARSREL